MTEKTRTGTILADLPAEQALLCGCLIAPHLLPQIKQIVSPEDFYSTAHMKIAQAIFDHPGHDLVSLAAVLREEGVIETIGGTAYLQELVDVVSSSAGWKRHADIIRNLSRRRRLVAACQSTSNKAEKSSDIDNTVSSLHEYLKDFNRDIAPVAINNETVLRDVVDKAGNKEAKRGIKTGFRVLDEEDRVGVMEAGSTIYLAARPSIGKTALAIALIDNALSQDEGDVLFFSLEMTGEAIQRRRLASRSGVYLTRLRHASVLDSQWSYVLEAANELVSPRPIIVDNPSFKAIERMTGYARVVGDQNRLGLIVVDHIQKMNSTRKSQSRHHELSYVSERLCDLAKELRVPVVVLCQLRRGEETGKAKRPQLESMKESGDLESNADIVLGLYREDKASTVMEVHCLKHRDGSAGWTEYLDFDPATQKFKDGHKPVASHDDSC